MRTPKFSHCILSLVSLMAHVLFSLLCALLLVPPPPPPTKLNQLFLWSFLHEKTAPISF